MQKNPIEQAEVLATMLQEVLNTVRMAARQKERLLGLVEVMKSVKDDLSDIHTNYIPLDLADGEVTYEGYKVWKDYEGSVIRANTPIFEDLVSQSPTLKYLGMAGIKVKSLTKYTNAELYFAKHIGANYDRVMGLITSIKEALNRKKGVNESIYIQRKGQFFVENVRFMEGLKHKDPKTGLVQGIVLDKFEVENKDKQFVAASFEEIKK